MLLQELKMAIPSINIFLSDRGLGGLPYLV